MPTGELRPDHDQIDPSALSRRPLDHGAGFLHGAWAGALSKPLNCYNLRSGFSFTWGMLVYVTSQTILPSTIDYYLGLIPGLVISHARRRLFNPAPEDRSPRPLSLKLLERPNFIRTLRSLIPDPDNAHLVTYNTTKLERDLGSDAE